MHTMDHLRRREWLWLLTTFAISFLIRASRRHYHTRLRHTMFSQAIQRPSSKQPQPPPILPQRHYDFHPLFISARTSSPKHPNSAKTPRHSPLDSRSGAELDALEHASYFCLQSKSAMNMKTPTKTNTNPTVVKTDFSIAIPVAARLQPRPTHTVLSK